MEKLCNHENFQANVEVARLVDENKPLRFQADVKIVCQACGIPFAFLGLPGGLNFEGAAVSIDKTEARLAIAPSTEVPWHNIERFLL
jgi:hypothetical protein